MPPQVAFYLSTAVIIWLSTKDKQHRKSIGSAATWIPLVWLFVLGSRPLSAWPISSSLGISAPQLNAEGYLEGSPFDKLLFFGLIAAGLVVVAKRPYSWRAIIQNNRNLFIFIIYLGVSTLWSEFPFVAFKRWFKDLGNVVMVLVILSEENPLEALKTVLMRFAWMSIIYSVICIKYYPDLGRYYDMFAWTYHYGGIAEDKNLLGMSLFVSVIFLFWNYLELRKDKQKTKVLQYATLAVVGSSFWLYHMAKSSTALSCTMLGCIAVLALKHPVIRTKVGKLGLYLFGTIAVFFILDTLFDIKALLIGGLGRDMTLTGRTDIWKLCFSEHTNPLIGVGFYSFWLGDRPERLSEGFWFRLNESHNGYIETYLNSGLIGLAMLAAALVAGAKRIQQRVVLGDDLAVLRLAFLIPIVMYNITEAAFNRLSPLWFVLLLALLEYPQRVLATATEPARAAEPEQASREEPEMDEGALGGATSS